MQRQKSFRHLNNEDLLFAEMEQEITQELVIIFQILLEETIQNTRSLTKDCLQTIYDALECVQSLNELLEIMTLAKNLHCLETISSSAFSFFHASESDSSREDFDELMQVLNEIADNNEPSRSNQNFQP